MPVSERSEWCSELSDVSCIHTLGYYSLLGLLTVRYSYWQLLYAFESSSGSISNLYNMINTVKSDCADTSLLGNFIENHDNPRFA